MSKFCSSPSDTRLWMKQYNLARKGLKCENFIIKSFSLFSSLSVLSFRCLEWQIISNHSYLLSIIKSLFYKNQDLSNRFHFPFFSLFPVSSFKVDYFQICEGHLLWIWQRGLRLNSWETFTICLFIWSSYQF